MPEYEITTIRFLPEQLKALRRAAVDRGPAEGSRKSNDVSAIIRELVDAWMAQSKR